MQPSTSGFLAMEQGPDVILLSEQAQELFEHLRSDLDGSPPLVPRCTGPVILDSHRPPRSACVCQRGSTYSPSALLEHSSREGGHLLESLRTSPPPWAHALPVRLPHVPPLLREWVSELVSSGPVHFMQTCFDPLVVEPPAAVSQYISGSSSHALRFRAPELGSFFASLFHLIQLSSCTKVELTGWDLFHCHLFLHCSETQSGIACDLGALFHAKEFPEEYRPSPYSPLYPISHPRQGGSKDPRIGTQVSSKDPDFRLRNYVWTLSANKLFLLDPLADGFDKALLFQHGGAEFHTCDERFFSKLQLGDVNYFPGLYGQEKLGCTHGDAWMEAQRAVQALWACGVEPRRILDLQQTPAFRWYVEQLGRLICHSSIHAKDVLFSPHTGVSTAVRIRSALLDVESEDGVEEAVKNVIAGAGQAALRGLLTDVELVRSKDSLLPCDSMVAALGTPLVIATIHNRLAAITAEKQEYNERQREELLSGGVTPEDAEKALLQTAFDGLYSSYKSTQLLAAAYARYRGEEERKEYGEGDFPWDLVVTVHRHTFYADCTLHALFLLERGRDTLESAVAKVSAAREAALESMLADKLHDHKERTKAGLPPKEKCDQEEAKLLALSAPPDDGSPIQPRSAL